MQQQDINNKNGLVHFFKALTNNVTLINSLLTILFIGTLYLTVFEVNIYRITLINLAIPISVWFFTGLILTPITSDFLKKYYDTHNFFLQLIFNVVTWGGLIVTVFMTTNYYFPNKSSKTITTKIIDIGHFAKGRYGCGQPYCYVVINNKRKQLDFPCELEVENYKFIELTIQRGLWGFDVITNKKLIETTQ